MALPLAALLKAFGQGAKGAGTALTAGKFLDAAIPGRSEKALRQVGKDTRSRLERDQYGYSEAEQEKLRAAGSARRGQTFKMGQVPAPRVGVQNMRDAIAQKANVAVLKQLGGQDIADAGKIRGESRQVGQQQKTADVKAVQDFSKDTQARTSALVGKLPQKTKDKGMASYLLEGGATLANKPKEDAAIEDALASVARVS